MTSYDTIGRNYTRMRDTEPRYAERIWAALGDEPILNVGAGSGSYEPPDRAVVAVEPSEVMVSQRPVGAAPAVRAVAERLPFADDTFGSTMGVLTVHHWSDPTAGLSECRRVTRGPIAVVCSDLEAWRQTWLARDYFEDFPDLSGEIDVHEIAALLGTERIEVLRTPADCRDGFLLAYWRRPEAYLDPNVRAGVSWFATVGEERTARFVEELSTDLRSGRWRERNADVLDMDDYDGMHRLVIA